MTTPSQPTFVASSTPAGVVAASMTCHLSFPNGVRIGELDDKITYRSGESTGDPAIYYKRSSGWHKFDAEAKLFDRLAAFFWNEAREDEDQFWRIKKAVKGTVYIVSSRGPCQSCRGVIDLFMTEFPNVRVVVKWRSELPASQATGQGGDTYGYSGLTASGGYYTKVLDSNSGIWDEDEVEKEKEKEGKEKG